MRTECIEAVAKAIGRPLKQGEADDIEKRILGAMTMLARQDPAKWATLSKPERYTEAANLAKNELLAEASKKAQRLAININARAKLDKRFKELTSQGLSGANAVERMLNNMQSYIDGIAKESFSNMIDTIKSAEPRFFGLFDNKLAVRDFVFEVYGKDTGNEIAKKGAKAWLEVAEAGRIRANKAGADIGKLDYGYIPQTHDQVSVFKAGKDAWVEKVMPLIDRTRYLDDAGNRMSENQLRDVVGSMWESIATGGLNKIDPYKQEVGKGSFASRGGARRELHFKGAEEWLQYHSDFGKGTLFDAMQNHVYANARNVGIMENMGTNPRGSFDMLNKLQKLQDGSIRGVGAGLANNQQIFNLLIGDVSIPMNPRMAEINQGIRNIVTAVKLQGTLLSSITDIPSVIVSSQYHRMPVFRTIGTVFKSFGSHYADYANTHGLIADSIISDMNRFADGTFRQGWTARLANATMKVQLLNAWTDSLRRGFSIMMMDNLGSMTRKAWTDLDPADIKKLNFQGITEDVFNIWKLATPENWRGRNMLTPDAIRAIPDAQLNALGDPYKLKNEAVTRLLGFIDDESKYAVTAPDLTSRASLGGGVQAGTIQGEFARHLSLFKSFPLAMANRHIRRAMAMNGESGTVGYRISMALGLVGFGALSVQLKSLMSGQDPADITEKKFWLKAASQSGGLGIYGDLLYTGMGGENRGGQPNWVNLLGPVFGTGFDLANVTVGNLSQLMRGEKTNAGAEIVRFTKQNTPFINLWYAKSAIDHLFLQDIQESLSPGYLARMKKRAYEDFGQRYWWEPGGSPFESINVTGGDFAPDRAPRFENAIGE